ncbi:MAG TPA: hypothetical protein VGA02_08560 [Gemmatimonadales bacterium]
MALDLAKRCDLDHRAPRGKSLPCRMVEITIERRWGGYTFLVNGRDDVVMDPEWGVTTFDTERAAFEAAVLIVRALQRAGERDDGGH